MLYYLTNADPAYSDGVSFVGATNGRRRGEGHRRPTAWNGFRDTVDDPIFGWKVLLLLPSQSALPLLQYYLVDADPSSGDGFSFAGGMYSQEPGPYEEWQERGRIIEAYSLQGAKDAVKDPIFGLKMGENSQTGESGFRSVGCCLLSLTFRSFVTVFRSFIITFYVLFVTFSALVSLFQ